MNFMSNARCVLLVGLLFCSACSAIAADKDLAAEWKFQTDAAGRWVFLNRAWEEITGFPVMGTLETNFLDYIHPEDRPAVETAFARLPVAKPPSWPPTLADRHR